MKSTSLCCLVVLLTTGVAHSSEAETAEGLAFFESKIRPVLIRECYGCHSEQTGNARGGLTLDTQQRLLIGGTTGPGIVPGNLAESGLWRAITYQDIEMPPQGRLSDAIIADFRAWIEMGAPDPRVNQLTPIQASVTAEDIATAKENFWAYQKPVKISPPTVKIKSWPQGEIDQFVLSKLEQAELMPSSDAESHNVLRRLTYDLIGLPPTIAQIDYFEREWNRNPQAAVAYVVDRLLESDHFGERWGRHWLDVARYGESSGRSVNMTYPQAWRYRDYVISSFNEDKPFDEFVVEQLAGDLLPVKTDEEFAENLVATTFLAIGSKNVNESNRVQFAADLVDEQVDATTRVFLGTSVSCARCHDHKFDPIPQSDYYALAGIFQSTKTFYGNPQSDLGHFSDATDKQTSTLLVLPVNDPGSFAKSYSPEELQELRDQAQVLREQMISERRGDGGGMVNAQQNRAVYLRRMSEISGALASVDEAGNPKSFCMGVQDAEQPSDARILVRGEIDQPSDWIARGFPKVLADQQPSLGTDSSGRLELARWIASPDNPLTSRVMVNRIWQHLIGHGIVRTTENFGSSGQMPTHPELLDYLAVRFVELGWSVKSLIREIATSRVYRISSDFRNDFHESDPQNTLIWRANSRRLDAEAIRDAMLLISGELQTVAPEASLVARIGYTRVAGERLLPTRQLVNSIQSDVTLRRELFGSSGGGGQSSFSTGRTGSRRMGNGRFGAGRFRSGGFGPSSALGGLGRPGVQGTMGTEGQRSMRSRFGMGAGLFSNLGTNLLDAEHAKYRSVYLPLVRDVEPRSLEVFDFVDANVVSGRRETSSSANQSLYLMNNSFVQQQSEAFASRLLKLDQGLPSRLEKAILLAYGREPTETELLILTDFVQEYSDSASGVDSEETWAVLCQAIFASGEFLYLD